MRRPTEERRNRETFNEPEKERFLPSTSVLGVSRIGKLARLTIERTTWRRACHEFGPRRFETTIALPARSR